MADDMITTTCPTVTCGVPFAVPRHIYDQAQKIGEKRVVYCPNGHSVVWRTTEAERLQKHVEQLQTQVEQLRALNHSLEEDAEKTDRTIRYWRGWAKHWKGLAQRKAVR